MKTPKTIIRKDATFDVKEFFCPPFIENVNDSMQLDSGQELVSLTLVKGPFKVYAAVRVEGEVRVIFRDQTYRCASQMPGELIEAYRDGKGPKEVALADGGSYETPYEVIDNNWLETCVVVSDKDGILCDTLGGDVIDGDRDTAEGWFDFLADDATKGLEHYLRDSLEGFASKVKLVFPSTEIEDFSGWSLDRMIEASRHL